jgi:adenine-specific DNA-methyltransferase
MMRDWLGKTVDRDDLTRHDKWCCMMLPRLKVLRELLTDDGAIFVSIDDNEVHHLRALMDDVFFPENFVATVIWEKADSPRMDAEYFSQRHDSVVVYARNIERLSISRLKSDDDEPAKHYDQVDEDGRKYYLKPLRAMGGQGETRSARPKLYYAMTAPDGTDIFPKLQDGTDGAWRWSKTKTDSEAWRIEWKKGRSRWTPYYRIYADLAKGRPPETIFFHQEVGSSRTARAQLKDIFQGNISFDTPKPVGLLRRILQIASSRDSIVLDSFAGSGTTAHAVLALNKEDGGNRRFILCQMPFETKEQEKKKENICERITAERMRRVIKGVPRAKDEALRAGLDGTFSYYRLGREMEKQAILDGKDLPTYEALAGYVFFTATYEEFQPKKMKRQHYFIGESREYAVFLIYDDDLEKLKDMALTLEIANSLPKVKGKRRLVFAPTSYLDAAFLDQLQIKFCQLPFEIYEAVEDK